MSLPWKCSHWSDLGCGMKSKRGHVSESPESPPKMQFLFPQGTISPPYSAKMVLLLQDSFILLPEEKVLLERRHLFSKLPTCFILCYAQRNNEFKSQQDLSTNDKFTPWIKRFTHHKNSGFVDFMGKYLRGRYGHG